MVGYGKNPPLLPFHKDSFYSYINYPTRGQPYQLQHDDFHDSRIPNRFIAYGALAGGPQADDTYEDSRGWCCAAFSEVGTQSPKMPVWSLFSSKTCHSLMCVIDHRERCCAISARARTHTHTHTQSWRLSQSWSDF